MINNYYLVKNRSSFLVSSLHPGRSVFTEGSVLVSSVSQYFGFQKMKPDRFSKITETDQFRFGFLVRFFGKNRKNRWHKTAASQQVSELILH
jgi:hypothetical protein